MRCKNAFSRLKNQHKFVDKSMEISNISITPRDLMDTYHIMTLIMN
jgi:hypothetical protein